MKIYFGSLEKTDLAGPVFPNKNIEHGNFTSYYIRSETQRGVLGMSFPQIKSILR